MEEKKNSCYCWWRWFVTAILLFLVGYWLGKDFQTGLKTKKLKANLAANPSPPVEVLNLQEAFVQVGDAVKPAVVNISAIEIIQQEYVPYEFYFGDPFEDFFEEFFGTPRQQRRGEARPRKRYLQRRAEATGSGVIISHEGYILTNEHVVHDADEIKVTVGDDEKNKYDGKVVGRDERTDLAVIKINARGTLPVAKLGDSDKVRVGDWAIAIGSPFGLQQTVTVGVISAVRQSVQIENRSYRDFFQTDAAINRGNSGGPLVNIHGDIIGINTAIFAPTGVFSGIGFAIPINAAKDILDDLIHKGKVVRGWLGVEIKDVDEIIAKQFKIPEKKGVLINNVIPDSPAEKAGLKRGDIIISLDNKSVSNPRELQDLISRSSPGKKVKLDLIRDGTKISKDIILSEMPTKLDTSGSPSPGQVKEAEWLGIKVSDLNDELKKEYGLPEKEKGVVVVELKPGSSGEEIGVQEGDLIISINRQPTPDTASFLQITKKVKLSDGIVLDINRRGRPMYLSYSGSDKE